VGGHLAPPKANPDETAIETMNTILGGSFSSRINMNLREDKHWSYGARSYVSSARGQRPFYASTSVQTDKTKDAMVEILKELTEIRDSRPVTAEELGRAQNRLTLRLPGLWETLSAVQGSISEIVEFGLPDDYYETYPKEVRALTKESVTAIAKKTVHPDNLVWVIMGDREKIEKDIRAANFGEVHVIDADGKML
jgi:zinc protease